MSLLLEALKKAEKAKPEAPPAAPPGARPELSLEEEPRPSERSLAHEPEPEEMAAPAKAAERRAAGQLFAAKTPPSRRGLAVAGGVLLVALLAGGAYVWYEISTPRGSLVASGPRSVAPAAPPASPPAAAAPAASQPAPAPAAVAPSPAASEKATAAPAAEPRPARRQPARAAPAAAPSAAPERIQIRRSRTSPTVNPDTAAGFDALARGDAEAARQSYQRALAADPASRDAALGLAAAEARRGNTGEALRLYQRVLELDPRDPLANAGLVALRPPGDAAQAESRLKLLLAQQPDSAPLHFALGNLLAGQSRWAEAQQEYFRAFSLEPAHPDYAFNLAVSLDQIGQRRLAADHYRRALALASGGAAGFDRAQAERRLQELEAAR